MKKMLKLAAVTISSAFLLCACSPASQITTNTDGSKVYKDDFSNLRDWRGKNENKWTANNVLVVRASPKTGTWMATNQSLVFTNLDATIEARVTSGVGDQGTAGLIFWCKDLSHSYALCYDTTGEAYVARWLPDKRVLLLPDGKRIPVPAIKKGLNQWNTLRVVVKDGKGIGYINGTKALEFDGQPPDGGGFVGITVMRSDGGSGDGTAQAEFRNLVVEY